MSAMPMFRSRFAMAMLALLMLMPWSRVWAACSYSGGGANVNFSVPTTITVPFDAVVGDVLYQTPQVAPSTTLSITCSGNTDYGVQNSVGATPGTSTAIYPTGITGVGYRLLHGSSDPSDYMYPFPCCRLSAGTYDFSVTTALQLVKTGPIANGARLNGATLAKWLYERTNAGATVSTQNYVLGNAVTFVEPACRLNTTSVAVALPTVAATSLPAVDATSGTTPFKINLTCSSGSTLNIMFDSTSAVTGKTGVFASATGTGRATGIGVQLVNSSYQPVVFKNESQVGATPQGTLDLNYYARYYRTGSTMNPGTISATATFTLSYD